MASLNIPYAFTNGTPANATEVNSDFTAVKSFVEAQLVQVDGSVKAPTIAIADDAITSAKIAASAVGTSEIADDAVTADKVADGATLPVNITGNAATATTATTATSATTAGSAVVAGTAGNAGTADNATRLGGKLPSPSGAASTISEVGSDGMVAAKLFGAASENQSWWVATTWGGETLMRVALSGGVYGNGFSGGRTVVVSSGGTLGYNTSSARYKQDIHPAIIDVDAVLSIQPVTYRAKGEYTDEADVNNVYLGVIAEQVDELGLKHLVEYDEEGRPDSIKYELISVTLLAVVKQQEERIAKLEEIVKSLTNG